MSILQDFFNGEVLPWEHFGSSDDPVFKLYSNKINNMENSLLDGMTEQEQKVFSEYKHLKMVQSNMELERMFLYAFRMGALFALDIYSE